MYNYHGRFVNAMFHCIARKWKLSKPEKDSRLIPCHAKHLYEKFLITTIFIHLLHMTVLLAAGSVNGSSKKFMRNKLAKYYSNAVKQLAIT